MVAVFFGGKTSFTGWAWFAIGSQPVAKRRNGTFETPPG